MNIGIDIDDVCVEFVRPYLAFHNQKFSTNFEKDNIKNHYFWKDLGISQVDIQNEFDDFRENHTSIENLPLQEGFLDVIKLISQENKIYFITARPEKIIRHTLLFFEKIFNHKDTQVFFSGEIYKDHFLTKLEICIKEKITLLIEDSPSNALECAQGGLKVLLFNQPWNAEIEHKNIIRVNNWKDILFQINKLEEKNEN